MSLSWALRTATLSLDESVVSLSSSPRRSWIWKQQQQQNDGTSVKHCIYTDYEHFRVSTIVIVWDNYNHTS